MLRKDNPKKICFITAARSEYGVLKWLMNDVQRNNCFQLQLIVTGGHLLQEQGHTIDTIINDGFTINATVDAKLDMTSNETIAESMGRMAMKLAPVFNELKPDLLVVLGDRYELLPICNTAFIMRIPIAHLSGGDITEGAIDDGVRNAVTMLAEYHFPGTPASAENIKRMRGSNKNIWTVGEPGLDALNRIKLMTRNELTVNLGLDINKKWCLMTYHPETKKTIDYNLNTVNNCFEVLNSYDDLQIVITYANTDFGGIYINELIEKKAEENPQKFKVITSLGQLRYLSYMKQVKFIIGNSSSGIIEAPSLGIPVVNIGNRQKGRYQCKNIIQCDTDVDSINESIKKAMKKEVDTSDCSYWGTGNTSEKILEIIQTKIFS